MKDSSRRSFDQLPLVNDRAARRYQSKLLYSRLLQSRPATMALLGLITLAYVCYAYGAVLPQIQGSRGHSVSSFAATDNGDALGVSQDVQQSWSMYSPYFPAGTYQSPPAGCEIDQVCSVLCMVISFSAHRGETRVPFVRSCAARVGRRETSVACTRTLVMFS